MTSIQLPDARHLRAAGEKDAYWKHGWGSMLSFADGELALVPLEDLNPTLVGEIHDENRSYTLDVLRT